MTFYDANARVFASSFAKVGQSIDARRNVCADDFLYAFDHYFVLSDLSLFVIWGLHLSDRHQISLLSLKLLAKLLKREI